MYKEYTDLSEFISSIQSIENRSVVRLGTGPGKAILATCISWEDKAVHRYSLSLELDAGNNPFSWMSAAAVVQKKQNMIRDRMMMYGLLVSDGWWTEKDVQEAPLSF